MSFFSIFRRQPKLEGNKEKEQMLDEPRTSHYPIEPNIYGNEYVANDISKNYTACYDYYNTVTALRIAIDNIATTVSTSLMYYEDNKGVLSSKDKEESNLFKESNTQVLKKASKDFLLIGSVFIRVLTPLGYKITGMEIIDSRVIEFLPPTQGKVGIKVGNIIYTYNPIYNVFESALSYIYVIKNDINHTSFGTPPITGLVPKLDSIIGYEKRVAIGNTTGIGSKKIITPGQDNYLNYDKFEEDKNKNPNEVYSTGINGLGFLDMSVDKVIDLSGNDNWIIAIEKFKVEIYSFFQIPLPLIESSSQTYSNYTEANVQYIEKAVKPVLLAIENGLNYILSLQRSGRKRINIDLNENTITSMVLKYEAMQKLSNTKVATINEVRAIGGLPSLGPEGDVLANESDFKIDMNNEQN